MIARHRLAFGLAAVVLAIVGMSGCLERQSVPLNPCTRSAVTRRVQVNSVDEVDLLFVIDNSNSMGEEQAILLREIPNMVRALASGEIIDPMTGMVAREFDPVRSLQVGVVSTDMGTGGNMVNTCDRPDFGDNGILINTGDTATPGCMPSYPLFLTFEPAAPGADPDTFAAEFACVAALGTGGCGFEQQLEAGLKAVSPSAPGYPGVAADYVPPTFVAGTTGHADGANRISPSQPFLRENSVLAVILVTDEEDCSAVDPELFNQSSTTYGGVALNLRCSEYADRALYSIDRYVNGFLQLRANPDLLVFAGIVGVPVDLVADPAAINYQAILDDPRMQEIPDSSMTMLTPSCNTMNGIAFPPRRIVQVASDINRGGGAALIQSICQSDYGPALGAIVDKIADALSGACLPRALNPDERGLVDCDVLEVLPSGMSCSGMPGREVAVDTGGNPLLEGDRNICRVTQIAGRAVESDPGSAGDGWYYDNFTVERSESCGELGQRISFNNIRPATGSEIRLECLQAVSGGDSETVSIGTFCNPDATSDLCAPAGLACDLVERACAQPCTTSSECTEAGLTGFQCDTRRVGEIVESLAGDPRGENPRNFCVNPVCN